MVTLDDDDLAIVQRGRAGMRQLSDDEQALVAASQRRSLHERRQQRRRRWAMRSAAVIALLGVSSGLYVWRQSSGRPDFDCGIIDTRARARCTGPTDPSKGCGSPQDWSKLSPERKPDKLPFDPYSIELPCRDGAIALSEGRATCDVRRSRDELYAEFAFYATIGGRCGAWNTCENGGGGVQPVWTGRINLVDGDWNVTITAHVVRAGTDVPCEKPCKEPDGKWPGSTCELSLDSHVLGSLDLGLRNGPPSRRSQFTEDKLSGNHTLTLRCEGPSEARSCTGGPPVWTASDESFLVTAQALRRNAERP